ncbi:MAG: DUF3108 domain-containing protein [Pseudomonadota bacterium]
MNRHFRFAARLSAAIVLGLCSLVAGAQTLIAHEATYKIKAGFARGELTTRLSRDGDTWVARHVATPRGLAGLVTGGIIDETSVFVVRDDNIRVQSYLSSDGLSKDKGRIELEFDWQQKLARGTVTPEAGDARELAVPLEPPLHDRLSIQYQLMHNLADDVTSGVYRMFDTDETKVLTISPAGSRRLKVSGKTYDAIGVMHQAEGSSRTTTLWCVPALGYLPALIEQRRKGKLKVRVTLQDYAQLEPVNASESNAASTS